MKPIKLGFIGCGIAATELHWPALQKLKDQFQITAVCNNTEQKARKFSKLVGGVSYVLDYKELLKNPDVEAIVIALPIYLNNRVTKEVLLAEKHVFVEKPLAANLEEARDLLKFGHSFSQVKMVGENWYHHPVFQRVRELIVEDRIGDPYAVFWDVFQLVTLENKYAQTKWRIEHKHKGGFITDGGIHNIAALRLMFGEIRAGNAFSKSINPAIGEVDTFSLQFETKNRVHGVLNIFRSPIGVSKNQLLVLGKQGSIMVEANKRILVKKQNGTEVEETIEEDTSYRNEFEDFYQAIRNGKEVVSSFSKAYEDLHVLLTALDSANQFHDLGTRG